MRSCEKSHKVGTGVQIGGRGPTTECLETRKVRLERVLEVWIF